MSTVEWHNKGGFQMNEQKSLIHYHVEAIDRYRADRKRIQAQDSQRQPGRLGRLLRWLTPNGGTLLLVALLILTTNVWARPLLSPASAPGPSAYTVNYQGRLADSGGVPLTGTYGMTFALWDAATGGSLVWGPESHAAVPVSDGLFSVGLGSQTSGGIPTTVWDGDRYLEITVGGETLSPRELIRSVPIAGMALTVPDGAITTEMLADHAMSDVYLVTNSTYHTLAGDGNWHDDPALTLTKDFEAGTLLIDVAANGIWCGDSPQIVKARLLVDGGQKQRATVAFKTADYNESSLSLQWVQSVSAGQHHIKVQWTTWGNCRTSNDSSARSLRVLNLKR
jgi:hypothetical protein